MEITMEAYNKYGGRPADVDAFMKKYPAPVNKARKAIPDAYAAAMSNVEALDREEISCAEALDRIEEVLNRDTGESRRRGFYESGLATAEKARTATARVKADLAAAKLKNDVLLAGGERAWREQVKERALLTRAKVEPVLAEYPPLSFELEEPEEKNELLDHMRQYVGGERAYFDWLREINKNRR